MTIYHYSAIISAIISLVALYLSIKNVKYGKNKSRIRLAINLTKQYKDILKDFAEINELINSHDDIKSILDGIRLQSNSPFNLNSINKIISSQIERKKLEEFFSYLTGMEDKPTIESYCKIHMISPNSIDIDINVIRQYYKRKAISILNELELFCMAFIHNIADDRIVYRSLHQSFFDMIKCFYYVIASHNISTKDCYYTNIISLFSKWKEIDDYLEIEVHKNQKLIPIIKPSKLKHKLTKYDCYK